jgi:hypothetical protein
VKGGVPPAKGVGSASAKEKAARDGAGVAAPRVLSPSKAMAELLHPLKKQQGVRIGCVGPTGSGKSYALRALVADAEESVDLVYVCADKPGEGAEWNGQERIDLADCRARPLVRRVDGGSRVVVLSGDPFARRDVSPDAVAADAWRLAAPPERFRSIVVVDELRRAAAGQRWREPDGDLPRAFTEGRSVGISVMWGCQSPQDVPREALGQSDLLLFRLEGREGEYLRRYRLIDDDLSAVVSNLPPRAFVVRRLGVGWDGRTYRF